MKYIWTIAVLLIIIFLSFYSQQQKDDRVIHNSSDSLLITKLKSCYNSKIILINKMLLFARQADDERLISISCLLKAFAESDRIVADKIDNIIKSYDEFADIQISPVEIKSSIENLNSLLSSKKEQLLLYVELMQLAQSMGKDDIFQNTKKYKDNIEVHINLLNESIANIERWNIDVRELFICPNCGYISKDLNFTSCPICSELKETFFRIQ